ncbi:solute carrier family 43 member 3a [Anableps anableps]
MQACEVGTKMRYWLTLISGMLECLCFAGVVFGYTSLVFVLKEDQYFSELCSNNTGSSSSSTLMEKDCRSQDEQFSLVFTITSFLNNFLSLINGYLFDRFGTMVTRLLAISLYTAGTLFVAFSSAAYSLMLFPALSCIAVGGILLLMTNIQVGNLFAAHRSTIITLYNGAFDSSSAVFLIIKILYEQGISLHSSFIALSLCSIIHVARTFLLMPRTHIPYPLPPYYTYGVNCGDTSSYNVEQAKRMKAATSTFGQDLSGNDEKTRLDETEAENTEKVESFKSCVLSWFFLWHLLWLSILQLRHYLFIGTLNARLSRLARNDPTLVSQYTNAFAMTQLCGVFCAPWNGLILDRHKGRPRAAGETEQDADLRSSSLSLFLTSLQCLLFSVCASIPVLPLQYLTFILQVLNRSFLYGGNAAFISIAFPAYHFGKLFGLVMSLSAVISLLQYPCFALVKGALRGDPFYVDIALTLLTALVFIHPANIFIHCRRKARSRENIPRTEVDIGPSLAQAKL